MKWNPVMKVWKKSELMSKWRKMLCFRVGIGLLPLIWDVWNTVIFERLLCFRVSIGLLPLWNTVMKVWKKSELMSMRYEGKCCYPLFWLSHEMKHCYEGLKEIRVDVNDIWRKMLCFRVSIGLLPLILIVSWNETHEMRVDVTLRYEGLKEVSELISLRYEGKYCVLE